MCIIIEGYSEAGLLVFWISPAYLVNLLSDEKMCVVKTAISFKDLSLSCVMCQTAVKTLL